MNLIKIAIPGLIGLVAVGALGGYWVNQIIQKSFHTEGTMFSEYATVYPQIRNPNPNTSFFCDPAYKSRWTGCTLK